MNQGLLDILICKIHQFSPDNSLGPFSWKRAEGYVDDSHENDAPIINGCAGVPMIQLGHVEKPIQPVTEFDEGVAV